MNITKTLTGVAALLFSIVTNAAIIDVGTYQLHEETGLEWLDLSVTSQQSISSALAANPGWTIATESQFQTMFEWYNGPAGGDQSVLGFDGSTSPYSNDSVNGSESIFNTQNGPGYTGNLFSSHFGSSYVSSGSCSYFRYSLGFYQNETTGDYHQGGAVAKDLKCTTFADTITAHYDSPTAMNNSFNYGDTFTGTFLVRAASNVPEPSSIALMVAGLLNPGFLRRRRERKGH